MKSYSVYLVANSDIDAIRSLFRLVETIDGTPWVRCGFEKDAEPPDDEVLAGEESLARDYSAQLGEVVFVYGDTSVDGFVYEHARDGEILRKLVWFPAPPDGTPRWMCADGEPEAWEKKLYDPARLEWFLNLERERYGDEGRADDFGAYERQVKSEWGSGRILEGRLYPDCDGTVAQLVERHYGIG